jgi:hypothetical protein
VRYFVDQLYLPSCKIHVMWAIKWRPKSNFATYFIPTPIFVLIIIFVPPVRLLLVIDKKDR